MPVSPWYNPVEIAPHTQATAEQVNSEFAKIRAGFDQLPAPNEVGTGEGSPNYTHFAYADSADGSANFTTGAAENRSYLGVAANRSTATPPENNEDYDWTRIQGPQGVNGETGSRGTVQTARAVVVAAWSDSEANAAILDVTGGLPITGDIVTLHRAASNFSQTRIRSSGATWTVLTAFFGGDVVVDRTLSANKVVANGITSAELATSNLITLSAQLGDAVVTNAKIGNLEVDTAKIANLSVATSKLDNLAVSTGKIALNGATVPFYVESAASFSFASGTKTTWLSQTVTKEVAESRLSCVCQLGLSGADAIDGIIYIEILSGASVVASRTTNIQLDCNGNTRYPVTFCASFSGLADGAYTARLSFQRNTANTCNSDGTSHFEVEEKKR